LANALVRAVLRFIAELSWNQAIDSDPLKGGLNNTFSIQ